MVFTSGISGVSEKPSSAAFIKMFERPDMSLMSTRR